MVPLEGIKQSNCLVVLETFQTKDVSENKKYGYGPTIDKNAKK